MKMPDSVMRRQLSMQKMEKLLSKSLARLHEGTLPTKAMSFQLLFKHTIYRRKPVRRWIAIDVSEEEQVPVQ